MKKIEQMKWTGRRIIKYTIIIIPLSLTLNDLYRSYQLAKISRVSTEILSILFPLYVLNQKCRTAYVETSQLKWKKIKGMNE